MLVCWRSQLALAVSLLAAALLALWAFWMFAGRHVHFLPPLLGVCALSAAFALLLRGNLGGRRRAFLAFALALAALLGDRQVLDSEDTRPTAFLPFTLAREGKLTVDARTWPARPLPYYWLAHDGRLASRYPVATALLALAPLAPALYGHFAPTVEELRELERIAAASLTALALALLYVAMQRLTSARGAAIAAAVLLLGTALLPVLGQSLWQHTGAVLSFSAAACALFVLRGSARALTVGLSLGFAVACRPVDLLLAAGFALALVLEERRWRLALPAGALPLVLVALYNRALFGSAGATGYGAEASWGWMHNWYDVLEGLAGILLSPSRGILIYSPVLLLGIASLLRPAEGVPQPRGLRILGMTALAYVALLGAWWAWFGGASPGPRMLSDAFPILGLGLGLATRRLDSPRRVALFISLAALSLAPNLVLAYATPSPRAEAASWYRAEGDWTFAAYPLVSYLR